MKDEITRMIRLLQFSDSAFPVGTFSFSNGLETAAFEGLVCDVVTLEQYTRTAVLQTVQCDAIAALIAYRAAARGDKATICEADRQVILCKMNDEIRLMLTRMGKKMAELGVHLIDTPLTRQWLEAIKAEEIPGTYTITQALFFQQGGLSEKELFVSIEYGVINMILNAALRCVRVSHYETQRILHRLATWVSADYEQIKESTFDDMMTFAPQMDIVASLHEKGKMRMFMN